MSEKDVLDIVTKHLNGHQPGNYHLDVLQDDVRQDGAWWYVVVKPDKPGMVVSEYHAILSDVEQEIDQDEKVKVLLVPAMAD